MVPADLEGLDLPEDWRRCEEYLQGIDLFNRAFFWESHEEWEALWHAVGSESVVGRYLQGLIQAAAALLKLHVGMPRGAASLRVKSSRNFAPARRWCEAHSRRRFMGIELSEWERRLAAHLEGHDDFPFLDPG